MTHAGQGPDADGATSAEHEGRPPAAVQVALALLVLLVVEDLGALVASLLVPALGLETDVLGVLARGAVCVVGARALQRGSRSGRVLLLLWALASLALVAVFTVVERVGPLVAVADTAVRGAALVALASVLALPSARRWCHVRSAPEAAAHDAAQQRRRARSHLPWPQRALRALRDDRDARR